MSHASQIERTNEDSDLSDLELTPKPPARGVPQIAQQLNDSEDVFVYATLFAHVRLNCSIRVVT